MGGKSIERRRKKERNKSDADGEIMLRRSLDKSRLFVNSHDWELLVDELSMFYCHREAFLSSSFSFVEIQFHLKDSKEEKNSLKF